MSAGSALTNTDGRDGLPDHLLLTAGALGFLDLGPQAGVVTLLLEAGVRPARAWQESGPPAPEGLDRYGIYLFPELGYSPADNWNLSLSGLLSPVDRSGVVAAGAAWNILQGLTFSFSATAMFGGDADTFAWNRPRRAGGHPGRALPVRVILMRDGQPLRYRMPDDNPPAAMRRQRPLAGPFGSGMLVA